MTKRAVLYARKSTIDKAAWAGLWMDFAESLRADLGKGRPGWR